MIKVPFIFLGVSAAILLPSCTMMDSIMAPPVPDRPLPQQPQEQPVTRPDNQLTRMQDRLGVDPNAPTTGNPSDPYLDRGNTTPTPPSNVDRTPTPPTPPVAAAPKKFPYATMSPNRPGFVLSPYTNAEIDVRGLKSGTLVRDPADPNPDHKFYVP